MTEKDTPTPEGRSIHVPIHIRHNLTRYPSMEITDDVIMQIVALGLFGLLDIAGNEQKEEKFSPFDTGLLGLLLQAKDHERKIAGIKRALKPRETWKPRLQRLNEILAITGRQVEVQHGNSDVIALRQAILTQPTLPPRYSTAVRTIVGEAITRYGYPVTEDPLQVTNTSIQGGLAYIIEQANKGEKYVEPDNLFYRIFQRGSHGMAAKTKARFTRHLTHITPPGTTAFHTYERGAQTRYAIQIKNFDYFEQLARQR